RDRHSLFARVMSVENESWLVIARAGDHASNALVVGRIARPHRSIIVQHYYGTGVNRSNRCIKLLSAIAISKNDIDAYGEGLTNVDIAIEDTCEFASPSKNG